VLSDRRLGRRHGKAPGGEVPHVQLYMVTHCTIVLGAVQRRGGNIPFRSLLYLGGVGNGARGWPAADSTNHQELLRSGLTSPHSTP
jgi:hypothetical protein